MLKPLTKKNQRLVTVHQVQQEAGEITGILEA